MNQRLRYSGLIPNLGLSDYRRKEPNFLRWAQLWENEHDRVTSIIQGPHSLLVVQRDHDNTEQAILLAPGLGVHLEALSKCPVG